MSKTAYAFCGSVFAVTFIVLVVILGGFLAQRFALTAAMCIAYSQFVAQDERHGRFATLIAYAGIGLAISSLVAFWVGA